MLDRLTLSEGTEGAGMLNDLIATENVTCGVSERFTMFLGDKLTKLALVLLQKLLVFQHISDALANGNLRPGLESILSILDSFVELSLGGHGNFTDDILGKRALNIEHLGR